MTNIKGLVPVAILITMLSASCHPQTTPERQLLTGVLRSYNLTLGYHRDLVDEVPILRAEGFELLWLIHTVPDQLGTLLDACQANGMQVLIDVGESSAWLQGDTNGELALIINHINLVSDMWGSHPAFYGWYLGHEIAAPDASSLTNLISLYGGAVRACHARDARPVMVSPFFILDQTGVLAGQRLYVTPDEYAWRWYQLLSATHVDIVAPQDSGEHMAYYQTADRLPFLEAMARACRWTQTRFWVNVETLELDYTNLDDYIDQNGPVPLWQAKVMPWRTPPTDRLTEKLRVAQSLNPERLVTWGR